MTAMQLGRRLLARFAWAGLAALMLTVLAAPTSTQAGARERPEVRELRDKVARVRKANTRYDDLEHAFTSGYRLLRDRDGIECIEQPGEGAMGIHFVNGELVGDPAINPFRPEAVIYEPTRNGSMRLVAVEYVVFQDAWDSKHESPPELFGRTLKLVEEGNRYGLPAFYELHAWLWKHNPKGVFADYNPRVDCSDFN